MDKKIEKIEKEIDSAVDKLFVDTSSPDFPTKGPETSRSDKGTIHGKEPGMHVQGKIEAEGEQTALNELEAGERQDVLQKIMILQSNVKAITEWGVTESAIRKISLGMEEIRGAMSGNKLVASISRMVLDVLDFLDKNPELYVQELADFLVNALQSLKLLIKPYSMKSQDPQEIFDSLNEHFIKVSSMLGFNIPNVELEEGDREAIDSGKYEKKKNLEESQEREVLDLGEALAEPAVKDKKSLLPNKNIEEREVGMDEFMPEENQPKTPEKRIEEEPMVEPGGEIMGNVPIYKRFHEIVDDLSAEIRRVEKSFFKTKLVLDLMKKLTTEIDSLNTLTKRFIDAATPGAPTDTVLKQFQKSVFEFKDDFKILSEILGPEELENLKVEEIIPAIVGKRKIGIPSQSVKTIYSISQRQEKKFEEEGHVNINGKAVPLIDLIKEFSQKSTNLNKRLIFLDSIHGERALLVDKVLKRRFALISRSTDIDSFKMARFLFTEEIPVFEIKS